MIDLSISAIAERIGNHEPRYEALGATTRQAAVATILRDGDDGTEALFILRATKDGDPWSGHMAFPGGHRDEEDETLRETAVRETQEELGFDLDSTASYLGAMDYVRANPAGRSIDMVVAPHFFHLHEEPEIRPNYEVADVIWGPLEPMYSGESLTRRRFSHRGGAQHYSGYGISGQFVWGLTYRMLDRFFLLMDPGWTPHE